MIAPNLVVGAAVGGAEIHTLARKAAARLVDPERQPCESRTSTRLRPSKSAGFTDTLRGVTWAASASDNTNERGSAAAACSTSVSSQQRAPIEKRSMWRAMPRWIQKLRAFFVNHCDCP